MSEPMDQNFMLFPLRVAMDSSIRKSVILTHSDHHNVDIAKEKPNFRANSTPEARSGASRALCFGRQCRAGDLHEGGYKWIT